MTRMITPIPAQKVTASTLGSAVAIVVLWALEEFGGRVLDLPVQGAVVLIATFAAGYFVPPAARDQIVQDEKEPTP